VFFVDEANNKATKVEGLHNRAPPFRYPMLFEESLGGEGVQSSPTTVYQPPADQTIKAHVFAPATTAAKSKENLYAKPGVGKCYRHGEPEHRSNECPKRKQVNMVNFRDDEGVVIEEASGSDFDEEHGDSIACVVQRLLCN